MTGQTIGMEIELQRASVRFNRFQAVQPTDLTIRAGEFFSILGPSGCGKTTLLRMISGFLEPTEGDVRIGGRSMLGLGPSDRPTALIFQNLALFPLMTVWENVAFGLEMRGWSRAKRRARAEELLATVALADHAGKLPDQLSGGQRQRAAIARALAVEPAVLLLDEPLSALDLKLRQHMRAELKQIQARTGITFVYITHDQGEALTMSDRVAVMNKGQIIQIGAPARIYDHPGDSFVATFVGEMNALPCKLTESGPIAQCETPLGLLRASNPKALPASSDAMLFIRPERLRLLSPGEAAENTLPARVTRRDMEGAWSMIVTEAQGRKLLVNMPNDGRGAPPEGEVRLGFEAAEALILPKGEISHD
ncbi:ABC transporter ATP-binding protein [Paracoccus sp. PAR01]|uniref:ABC transporter ATP-binding protein n=1 Tax=Paracoccus sp. PAR01 TaxID=2769282 RepID=UPI001CE1286B|nr:ABC transporter ATP-binding protein [Paracoccus sp. PAR01]